MPDPHPLRERITTHLARFERRAGERNDVRAAAVAVVVTIDGSERPCFLLTRRADKLRRHGGQWALPGGRLDPGETAIDAALRELREELGVDLAPDRLLGQLDDYVSRSGFAITPAVLWGGPGVVMRPDPDEVAEAHEVPLSELALPGVPHLREIPESDRPVISFPLVGTHVHAPTAAILFQLHEVAVEGRDTRVAHYEQPVFAWS